MEISVEHYNKMAERLAELEYKESERQRIPKGKRQRILKGKWMPHDVNGRESINRDCCSVCGERFYQIAETGCKWNF